MFALLLIANLTIFIAFGTWVSAEIGLHIFQKLPEIYYYVFIPLMCGIIIFSIFSGYTFNLVIYEKLKIKWRL